MKPNDQILTTSVNLSAVLMTLTGVSPTLLPGRSMGDEVEIVFPATGEILCTIQRYITGELLVPVKKLLVWQKTLTTYVREVKRLHKGVTL